ncbi:hypothetical protein ABN080_03350 [Proteus sp. fly-1089]|uniref:hypothetical protein n=1 Tax=Proteus sp. fly-1089 TaxID=3136675 RepID=UPI0032D9B397
MTKILSNIVVVNNTPFYKENIVINNSQLNSYKKLLNNINNIQNTHLEIIVENDNEKRKMSLNVAQLAKNLISDILDIYISEGIAYNKINMKNTEKSKNTLAEIYEKADGAISEWWENEKIILPSSIVQRAIDNLYLENGTIMDKKTKENLFLLISKKFDIKLNIKAAQSSMIQQLQNIPMVVEEINKLNIPNVSNNSYLIYDIYSLLAESIYNILLGNEKMVKFSELKEAVKEISQRKISVHQNKLNHPPLYPINTFFSHEN